MVVLRSTLLRLLQKRGLRTSQAATRERAPAPTRGARATAPTTTTWKRAKAPTQWERVTAPRSLMGFNPKTYELQVSDFEILET